MTLIEERVLGRTPKCPTGQRQALAKSDPESEAWRVGTVARRTPYLHVSISTLPCV